MLPGESSKRKITHLFWLGSIRISYYYFRRAAATRFERICKNMAWAWISTNCMGLNELSSPCVGHLLFLFQACGCDKGVKDMRKYGAVMEFKELSSPLEQRQNWIKKADQCNERGGPCLAGFLSSMMQDIPPSEN